MQHQFGVFFKKNKVDKKNMKNSSRFTVKLDPWIDKIISMMSSKEDVPKSYIINELLRSKLADMGYIEKSNLIDRLSKNLNEVKVNDDTQLLG